MSIQLNSTSGGSVSLDPVSSLASDITLTLPDSVGSAGQVLKNGSTAGTLEFANGGKILQVVQTHVNTADSQALTASTIAEISGLSVSITPTTTTSNMLVFVRWNGEPSVDNIRLTFGLRRDSTDIGNPATAGSRIINMQSLAQGYFAADNVSTPDSAFYFFLDETRSESLSQITYKATCFHTITSTLYNQRTVTDTDTDDYERLTSSIIVMEVAA